MARIRTVKPEYWTDEKIVELSITARLFFIGLWNFADDAGNARYSSRGLKMQVFPADNIDVEPLIRELIGAGLIQAYEADGKMYLNIKGWHHQKISNPSYKYPALHDGSIVLDSPREPSRVLDSPRQSYPPEGKGRDVEGKGIDNHQQRLHSPPREEQRPEPPPAAARRGASLKRDYDDLLADCGGALGPAAPADAVIGPMADVIARFGRETVLRKLAELSRVKRAKPVRTWSLWAKIVTDAIVEASPAAAEATPEDPLITFDRTRAAVPRSELVNRFELWRDKGIWPDHLWGPPPGRGEVITGLCRDLIGLDVPMESEAAE